MTETQSIVHANEPESFDPAPNPITLAHERSAALMKNLTDQGLDQLRQFRDDTDALMLGLSRRHAEIVDAINTHAENVAAVIDSKQIMAEQMEKLKALFSPMQKVMTLNGGGQR